jgi:outer membrane lipoprotein-sorting protein
VSNGIGALLATATACLLSAQDLGTVVDKTVQRYKDMKSFQTEFTQTLCDEAAGMCSIYEGKL